MNRKHKPVLTFQLGLSTLASACLVACGGGGTPTAATDTQLSGVAAYGAPLANATITVMDSNGNTKTTTADSEGHYSSVITGMTAPLLLKASGSSGDSVKEYTALVVTAPKAGETSTANVTPLTHALVSMASGDGANPNEFTDASKLKALDTSKVATALANLQAALKDVLADAQLDAHFDPLTANFKADRNSAADVLLDTIKVGVSDQGVSLTNARVPASDTGTNTATATITIKGTGPMTITPLTKPTIKSDDLKGLDAFVKDANQCLALVPTARASKDSNGNYTFLGACNAVSGFDNTNYQAYGYSLSQLWGARLLEQIPENSKLLTPEFLLFTESGNKALVRLATTSPSGGKTYFEVAAKTAAGTWQIVGNQRNYDASIGVGLYRQTDMSTNGWKVPASYTSDPDAGKNVGKLNAYTSRLSFSFNQTGPKGSNVYAIRVKGPGLPDTGIVLSRSSACGTNDYLAFYSNKGILPTLTTAGSLLTTTSASNSWTLDVANFGDTYKGSNFYNQYRGQSSTGVPSTASGNSVAPKPADLKAIPEFALYTWEVFTTASGASAAETFTSRIIARPLAAAEGAKQAWATMSNASLAYLDPTNTTLSGDLTDATISWSLPASTAPAVTSAYIYGSNNASVRMNMGQSVAKLGDTSLKITAEKEANGNGEACSAAKVPGFTATTDYREVGVRQTTDRGMKLQQYSYHSGRAAN